MTNLKINHNNQYFEDQKAFAEVMESNLNSFTAQCWKWDDFAKFGSLLKIESEKFTTLGCVIQSQTGSTDPMRNPFPYKKTESELMAEQPQIFEYLKTTFTAQIIGYLDKSENKIIYQIPEKPCKIHSFISYCSSDIAKIFFSEPLYLHIIFKFLGQNANFDELLLTILRNLSKEKILSKKIFGDFCNTFSILTGNDYRRLKLFLTRVEKIV